MRKPVTALLDDLIDPIRNTAFSLVYRAKSTIGRYSPVSRRCCLRPGMLAPWLVAAAAAGAMLQAKAGNPDVPAGTGGSALARTVISGEFELVDHTGKMVTGESYAGKYLLVFFGYTNCPDICPTTLYKVSHILKRLGEHSSMLQPIFITVDPQRDTPEVLARYLSVFDERIIGLSGSTEQVQNAAKSFRAHFEKVVYRDSETHYTIDHSAYIYLLDQNGQFVTVFAHNAGIDVISSAIEKHLASPVK